MKDGVFLVPQQPRTDDPLRRFGECLEQTRLARLAGETGSMVLVLSIVLLALLNPQHALSRGQKASDAMARGSGDARARRGGLGQGGRQGPSGAARPRQIRRMRWAFS
jgi:hypothetical protein